MIIQRHINLVVHIIVFNNENQYLDVNEHIITMLINTYYNVNRYWKESNLRGSLYWIV